jgi:hypothetical protein
MLNANLSALVKAAQAKGIKFQWETTGPKGAGWAAQGWACGWYSNHKGVRTIHIRKGMSQNQTEETIVHEIAHALWDLSLPSGKRKSLKKMRFDLGFLTQLGINLLYSKGEREEERFAYSMQTRPTLVLHLLNQI